MITTGLSASKREARELISSGAVLVNGLKMTDFATVITKKAAIGEQFSIIRKGKKKYALIKHE
jgi:tyrosyl-tRNA synthetase